MSEKETVVVLGASPKEDRYSNRAVRMLLDYGYDVIPIHPVADAIHGVDVVASLEDLAESIDTVTVYLGAGRSSALADALVNIHPRRVIVNPGAENEELEQTLEQHGIVVEHACTLVLLQTGQF